MELKSDNRCSSMITMTIFDDGVFRMCPSDLIGWDNIGKKGVRLGQKVRGEPVSDEYKPLIIFLCVGLEYQNFEHYW